MRRFLLGATLALATLPGVGAAQEEPPEDGRGDATVVAIIDSGIAPYHWDYLASKMPQAQDTDLTNDLPLDQPPDTWLPGFPAPGSFLTYASIPITLEQTNPSRSIASMDSADSSKWSPVKTSTSSQRHYYWLPGTKVIGAMTFLSGGKIHAASSTHGQGTTSSAAGNIFGTCPECLLVFIQYGGSTAAASAASGEAAIAWAMSQPWIDVISNSYGFGPEVLPRSRLYSGSDTALQRTASERGQTIFFSAGNGVQNDFITPNPTLFSSQEGPDWIVTVGAVHPTSRASYTGHGKPADVAGIGGGYPTSYTATTVSGQGASGFGGTSNATPQVAGHYLRALYLARRDLPGTSRSQAGGVIAVQGEDAETPPFACGAQRPGCELADAVLTAPELRTRFFHGATRTAPGMTVGTGGTGGPLQPVGEDELLNEGHGTYFGRLDGPEAQAAEFERILGPLEGRTAAPARPGGEREWMIVDSYCRQEIWGDWAAGAYLRGQTALPGPSPLFPVRSALEVSCPVLFPPV